MMIRALTTFIAVSLVFLTSAQLGYIGNRSAVSLSLTSNYGIIQSAGGQYLYTSDPRLCIPKIGLGVQHENKKGRVNYMEIAYQQLPNSIMIGWGEESDPNLPNGVHVTTYYDSLFTRSDNYRLSYGMRNFKELSPLGVFFDFRMSLNIVNNKSLFQKSVQTDYNDLNYSETNTTRSVVNDLIYIPEFGFGIGKVVPINKRMAIDYGARFNVMFGKYKNKKVGDTPRITTTMIVHKIASSKKIVTANLIEVYASFLLFH